MQTEIKLWKENNIDRCVMEFSCGGDSMNETDFTLYDKDDNAVECTELTDYFESVVYDEVDFYEVSDGHYMGEFGQVEITLEEDDEDENGGIFLYDKQAKGEWEESFTGELYVEVSEKEKEVLDKLSNFNSSPWDSDMNINYKDDCIILEEEEETLNTLLERIKNLSDEFEIDGKGEEQDEARSFECEIEFDEGKLLVIVSSRFYYTDESYD
jgi:hypothetical protein